MVVSGRMWQLDLLNLSSRLANATTDRGLFPVFNAPGSKRTPQRSDSRQNRQLSCCPISNDFVSATFVSLQTLQTSSITVHAEWQLKLILPPRLAA